MKKYFQGLIDAHKYILLTDVSTAAYKKYLGELPQFLFLLGSTLLTILFVILFVTTVGFFFHLNISANHLLTAIFISMVIFNYLLKNLVREDYLIYYIGLWFVVILAIFFSSKIARQYFDLSYDGQSYHQETIIALNSGWNPVWVKLSPFENQDISFQKLLNSYPKGSEIIEAVIYKTTNKIEDGKALNLVLFLTSFCLVLSVLLRIKVRFITAVLCTIILVANPVVVTQIWSYYLDGQLYLLILSLLSVMSTLFLLQKNYIFLPLIFNLGLLINMKVTAVFTALLLLSGFLLICWYSERILLFFKTIQISAVSFLVGIAIIGFNPYITNIFRYGHPFYPTMGKNASDYIRINMPGNLYKKNSVERFFISAFSRSSGARGPNQLSVLKWPFTIKPGEINVFFGNTTIGGFGPLFSGILILSGILLIPIVFSKKSSSKNYVLFTLILIIISSWMIPVSSYARFIPQFWLVPGLITIYLLNHKNTYLRLSAIPLLLSMIINVQLVGTRYFRYNQEKTAELKKDLQNLAFLTDYKPMKVNFDVFRSNRVRFAEAGIKFVEDSSNCNSKLLRILRSEIPESKILACFN